MAGGVDKAGAVLQHLRLAVVKQYYRSPHSADIERFVVLVQHQNRKLYYFQAIHQCQKPTYFTKKVSGYAN